MVKTLLGGSVDSLHVLALNLPLQCGNAATKIKGCFVSTSFSLFRKKQVTFECRYEDAYLIWDRSGRLWSDIGKEFKNLRSISAAPNQVVFSADDRFNLSVGIDRASITDFRPDASWERSFDVLSNFFVSIIDTLEIEELSRIGTRFIYSQTHKTMMAARQRSMEFGWVSDPRKRLFRIETENPSVVYKLENDDGDLGYIAQVYAQEQKLDIASSPEFAAFDLPEMPHGERFELVLDLDFQTKKPVPIESFSIERWLSGWQRAINQDADTFLNMSPRR